MAPAVVFFRLSAYASYIKRHRAGRSCGAQTISTIGGTLSFLSLYPTLNKTIHPSDSLAPVYRAQYSIDEYFNSALRQLDIFNDICLEKMGKGLGELSSIADFACHYGRMIRALRPAAPQATVLACDIDNGALEFCAGEFSAKPFHTAWTPAHSEDPPKADLVICLSLVTHTRLPFFTDVLELWRRMVTPGGLLLFTFLGANYMRSWQAGEMAHYGPATPEDIARGSAQFAKERHAFHSYMTSYSDTEYGVGFMDEGIVAEKVRALPDMELLEIRPGASNGFGQDLAIVRRKAVA